MTDFSVRKRAESIGHAFRGLGFMLRSQHNAWLHAVATVIVVVAGFAFGLSSADWKWLVATIAMVWVVETLNTAVEHVCDVVSPDYHDSVKVAKDVAAGAVLISAIGAVIMGLLIFTPYLFG